MNDILRICIMAFLGLIIGWLTNKVAIKMLFRPATEKKFLFIKFHGILPKRQNDIADSIGEMVANDLLSTDELVNSFADTDTIEEYKILIGSKIIDIVSKKIPPMVTMMLGGSLDNIIRDMIDEKGDEIVNSILNKIKEKASDKIDIQEIVSTKIKELDFASFERIVVNLVKKELKYIEVIGAVLGFFIGTIQGIITIFL